LLELGKEDSTGAMNNEVKLNIVQGIRSIAKIMGTEFFECQLFHTVVEMISEKSQQTWRLKMAVFE